MAHKRSSTDNNSIHTLKKACQVRFFKTSTTKITKASLCTQKNFDHCAHSGFLSALCG
ncbi:hypothetical protein SAMN03080601_01240 [Alkalitalea saponilacus]|uniref:Uncharacterized protein n=1 Tax=Alkalitalea saponilacus TaxID=889453 RepID=A0A1T5E8J1_9BACT|nr:hypothetical protein SAMN03080601_01240 [Alkalitalea saponilacus]